MKLPQPILGNITAFTISTPDLEKSLAFYEKLGFSLVMRDNWPFPWIQVSDGVVLIMLRKDPKPYLALTYYVADIDKVTKGLQKKGITFEQAPKKGDPIQRYLINSPDGLMISLVGIVQGFSQPPGPGMLQMKQEDYFKPEQYVNKTAGLFGELAHPVADLEKSILFWEKLGFTVVSKFTAPYPWAVLSDGLAVVGLHQATNFSQPAITYFAADMSTKIAAIKKSGIKTLKEKDPSNAVVTTPEKQQIFLYQLGGAQPAKNKKAIDMPSFETERLILKEINPAIADELFTTCSDEEIMSIMGLQSEKDLAMERYKWENGMTTYRMTYKRLMLVEKTTGKVVGGCSLHNWYPEHRRAELGYHMSDESAKNKGYMTEAVKAITTFGFDKMELNRVEAFTSPDNVPSVKLLSGLGFVIEGTMLAHYFKEGRMHDSVVFRLLKDEYKKVKKGWK